MAERAPANWAVLHNWFASLCEIVQTLPRSRSIAERGAGGLLLSSEEVRPTGVAGPLSTEIPASAQTILFGDWRLLNIGVASEAFNARMVPTKPFKAYVFGSAWGVLARS